MIQGFLSIPKTSTNINDAITLVCESQGDDLTSWSVSNGGEHVADITINVERMKGNDLRDRLTAALATTPYLVLP